MGDKGLKGAGVAHPRIAVDRDGWGFSIGQPLHVKPASSTHGTSLFKVQIT